MGSGFSRHRSVKFHPSVKISTLQCKIGQPFGEFTTMIIQQSLIQEGCWLDPLRSIVKAAASLRRECNRIMVAFYEGNLEETLQSILRTLRSGCRIERRSEFPSTAQLLLDGLDWQVELLIT